jgi:IS1 family transposase
MPLPQLKKEIFDEAGVDFHIYTADKFLEYQQKYQIQSIDITLINEVREIEELKVRKKLLEYELHRRNLFMHRKFDENRHLLIEIYISLNELIHLGKHERFSEELRYLSHRYSRLVERSHINAHINDRYEEYQHLLKEIKHILMKTIESEKTDRYYLRQTLSLISKIDKLSKLNGIRSFRDFEL